MSKTLAPDVLTTLLRALRLRVRLMSRGDYCGQWALDSGQRNKASFHYVGRGEFWMHCRSRREPALLKPGDLLFFPRPQWHQFSASEVCEPGPRTGDQPAPGKAITTILCCVVEFDSGAQNPLLSALPDIVLLNCEQPRVSPDLGTLARLMLKEHDDETPGHKAMIERLAEALFIEILRHQMRSEDLQGVLRALADPQLAPAVSALHEEPGRAWDVESLAAVARLSRSAFARRFAECMEMSPMQYVAQWRMQVAEQLLRDPRQSVARVAEQLGYGTEAAFRHTFKRLRGVGPGQIRRQARI